MVPLPPGGCRIAAPGALTGDEGVVTEVAAGRRWAVDAAGFWQVHPAAADTLVGAVLDGLRPEAGERALDLYCGVGLFAGALADAGCRVWAVEGSRSAAKLAEQNLADVADRVTVRAGRVERVLRTLPHRSTWWCWTRRGPGPAATSSRRWSPADPGPSRTWPATPPPWPATWPPPPASATAPSAITAYDLFPMTHHVECVAVLDALQQRP